MSNYLGSQPIILINEKKDKKIIIAPRNSDIDFEKVPSIKLSSDDLKFLSMFGDKIENPKMMEQFSWSIPLKTDSPEILRKKRLISPPKSQGFCGNCWAVTISTTLSDCYVVYGLINWSPSISATYLLSCVSQSVSKEAEKQNERNKEARIKKLEEELKKKETTLDAFGVGGINMYGDEGSTTEVKSDEIFYFDNKQCLGSNIAEVVLYLGYTQTPLLDTSCIDYSWCNKEWCGNPDVEEILKNDYDTHMRLINKLIPVCGCYNNKSPKLMYRVDKNPQRLSMSYGDVSETIFRDILKAHILSYGPAIAGFILLSDFTDGNFTSFNGGIYFDRANYSIYDRNVSTKLTFVDDATKKKVDGFHAASIVGWGIEPNVQYDNDKTGPVPYWHVRNSWGTDWGDKGYFKLAMYPFNKIVQIEMATFVSLSNDTIKGNLGTTLLIKATSIPESKSVTTPQLLSSNVIYRECPSSYYSANPDQIKKIHQNRNFSNIPPQYPMSSQCPFNL